MNRLVIIGNGFDLAHGLKTSYKDFIEWYWEQRIAMLFNEESNISKDPLCTFEWMQGQLQEISWKKIMENVNVDGKIGIHGLKKVLDGLNNEYWIIQSDLLKKISKDIDSKGWVDIENDYYALLKGHATDTSYCKELNYELQYLRDKLVEYLSKLPQAQYVHSVNNALCSIVYPQEIATSSKRLAMDDLQIKSEFRFDELEIISNPYQFEPHSTMLLDFNYTDTSSQYDKIIFYSRRHCDVLINHIHGEVLIPQNIIFGYGDEIDADSKQLENLNENELLKNSKSVKYLETSHYRDLLSFIEGGPFQVYIMGHSCGNSDRTLLNTIFEHQNCISIKPFCYINENNEDNYSELTRNIYRNFTDKKLFRDRVVNKERCSTLDGRKLNCQTQAETH